MDDILRTYEAPPVVAARLPEFFFVAKPECMAGSTIDFRLVDEDRVPLLQALRDGGGQLPAVVRLTRACQVCGEEHEFEFPLTDGQRQVLERWLNEPAADAKQPETAADSFNLDNRDPYRSQLTDAGYPPPSLDAAPQSPLIENRIEDPADRPVPRANRLYDEAFKMKGSDPAGALRKMEESLKLFRQVGRDNSAAYVGITIAELELDLELKLDDGSDRGHSLDPEHVCSLLEHARDTLAGDPIHAPKVDKAVALLERLAAVVA